MDSATAMSFLNHSNDKTPTPDNPDQNNEDWTQQIKSHGNFIAFKRNMHSHTSSCYKYGYKKSEPTRKPEDQEDDLHLTGPNNKKILVCRFMFLKKLHPQSHVDENGMIHLQRNNPLINS